MKFSEINLKIEFGRIKKEKRGLRPRFSFSFFLGVGCLGISRKNKGR
jgi:hypothetical protein